MKNMLKIMCILSLLGAEAVYASERPRSVHGGEEEKRGEGETAKVPALVEAMNTAALKKISRKIEEHKKRNEGCTIC